MYIFIFGGSCHEAILWYFTISKPFTYPRLRIGTQWASSSTMVRRMGLICRCWDNVSVYLQNGSIQWRRWIGCRPIQPEEDMK